ncbi:MAG: DNA (cytosine-5-)-methyltransferase, partial [Clostridia bacterium]|nr:DNA (cytosine-5-)-methyltransferase [Clostridia bacterium]
RGKFRYLTPRECLLFMGFTDEDYERLQANNPKQRKNSLLFPRDKIIRMAGNSIPVKMLEGFFYQLYDLESIINKKNF